MLSVVPSGHALVFILPATLWLANFRASLCDCRKISTNRHFYKNASCWPLGSRRLLTPNPNNRKGRDTSFSRPNRKHARR